MLRIIVVAYRNGAHLPQLLDSLNEFLQIRPAQVLVWDNGETRAAVESWAKKNSHPFELQVAGGGENLGYARAANEAARFAMKAAPDDLIFLNPDALLASPLTPEILASLEATRALCGFRVFDDALKTHRQASARRFPMLSTSIANREGLLRKLWPSNPWSKKYLGEDLSDHGIERVDWVSGCAFYSSRDTWEKLGGYDENYFLYVEDVDLGRKAQAQGVPVLYFPRVDVVHEARGSATQRAFFSDWQHHRGMLRYFWKWSPWTRRLLLFPAVVGGVGLRLLARAASRKLRPEPRRISS